MLEKKSCFNFFFILIEDRIKNAIRYDPYPLYMLPSFSFKVIQFYWLRNTLMVFYLNAVVFLFFSVGINDSSVQIVNVRPIHRTVTVSILPYICAWYLRKKNVYVKFYSAWEGDHLQVCAFGRTWKCLAPAVERFFQH